MGYSFRELSAWISLAVIGSVSAFYLNAVAHAPQDSGGLLIQFAAVVIILEIVLHVLLSLFRRPEAADERDSAIAGRGYRLAYFALASGAFLALVVSLMPVFAERIAILRAFPEGARPANILILTMIAAEVLNYGSQIVSYRRGH